MKAKFLDVGIERIVPEGYGIAFAENLTIFVPLVVAGDFVRVRIERQKGKVAFAELVGVLEASENRIVPPCPYFGRCGGCDFQQMNYETQLASKVGIIRDCLRRIGKIDLSEEIKINASPAEWHYRTRAQWKREGNKIGYFERKSHRVCDVVECPIIVEPLEKTLLEVRENPNSGFLELQAVAANDEVSLRFDTTQNPPEYDENFYAANKNEAEKPRAEFSPEKEKSQEISLTINNFSYAFSADTFFQVNHAILPLFVNSATNEFSGRFALDLYCGVGLFTLPLAKQFKKVIGIEGNSVSIEFAQKNAINANLANVEFQTESVGLWLKNNVENLSEVDFVLLDPPRSGAERETIESLISIRPHRVNYVSCNPATLARDLRELLSGGYEIEKIEAFDLFPQTHHIETIAFLKLSDS